ncbi:MAG: hypothetical protein KatS3mg102_1925 [Planctomycetota bacterium]|nr:MAG: hypothetical protein KatS3mg102_1925 [Planctomycetota bacterium]
MAAAATARGAEVLVVESDGALRALLCRALRAEGYRVREAEAEEQALELLAHQPGEVALAVLALPSPCTRGAEALDRLLVARPGLAVVVLAGLLQPWERRALLRRGARACLSKPFRLEALRRAVRAALAVAAPSRTGADG